MVEKKKKELLALIDTMVKIVGFSDPRIDLDLENDFRMKVFECPENDEALAEILPALVPKTAKEEPRINIALDILSWLLEELRIDMERGRKGAVERMERLQEALARHVFREDVDAQLCAAVGRILLESRVEVLPVIHDANSRRMFSFADGESGSAPPEAAAIIVEALEGLDIRDPHEALGAIMDQTGLLEPAWQVAICGEMLAADSPLLRETAALMLFHPRKDVRDGVARLLSQSGGERISPDTLRRLIIARNWFPPEIRGNLDTTINNARRARVECAPLKGNTVHSVHATTIDGAGAQSLWVSVGVKKHVDLCNILLKQGVGVIDTFIHRLPSVKAADRFMEGLPEMMCFAEVGMDYADRAMGSALADGIERGATPHRGLLQIAELIGTDRWKAEPLDPERELALLRGEMTPGSFAADEGIALEESAEWPGREDFADTWFEENEQVDRVFLDSMKGRGRKRANRGVADILALVMEPRREVWLKRLLLMTLWLKSSPTPPLPWRHMFFLAEALASGRSMGDIPLMRSIAELSLAVAEDRLGNC
jgi:hypothetical protein